MATKNGGGGIQNQKQEPHTKMWGKKCWAKFCPGSCPPACQEIRSIFAKISLIFDKNRPYFLTGNGGNQKRRRRDTEPKTRTPHKDVGKKCWEKMFSQILPRQLPTCPSRNKVNFCQNKPYFWQKSTLFFDGQRWQPKTRTLVLSRQTALVFGCHRCPSKNKAYFCQK